MLFRTSHPAKASRLGLAASASACALAAALAPHAALAQAASAPAGAAAATPNQLTEVVVTATKVETNVQKTALAVDVYGGAELQQQGVRDVSSLAAIAPSVQVIGTGAGTVVTMRGISSRDTTEVGDPAVAINVDGFYQDRSYAIGLTQYDLDRIEVVKGPQGTLSGRNATAGAINIITAKPTKTFGGYVAAEAGNYSTLNTEGAVNVPITDQLQARASFSTNYHDGYRNSGPIAGRTDDQNTRSGRLQLSFQPTENLRLHVLAQHTTQSGNNSFGNPTAYNVDASGNVVHQANIPYTDFYNSPVPTKLSLDDSAYRWDAQYLSPFVNVSYFGGYDDLVFHGVANASTFSAPAGFNPVITPATFAQNEEPKTWNHEVRFTSPNADGRLTWQFGAFYFHDNNHLFSVNSLYPSGNKVISFLYDVAFDSLAEFGQVAYKVTDNVKITVGARHNKDAKSRNGFIFFGASTVGAPTVGSATQDKNTYHAALDWQVTPRSLLYAKYDTGYKAGGFTDVAPYGPELVTTYEVGSKNRFMDNRLQLNGDVFYSDYTGQQVSEFVATGGGTQIVNAGKTRYIGVEGDALAVLDFGRLDLNITYLDAKFTDFPIGLTPAKFVGGAWTTAPSTNVNLKGNVPPNAPQWAFGGSFDHTWNVWNGTLTGRVQSKYTSRQFFTFFNRADEQQGAFTNTNLTLTYAPSGASWEIQGYVRNVEDGHIFSNEAEGDRGHNIGVSYMPPRTYGARVTVHF